MHLVWAKIEDHHALINDAEVYPKLTGEIAKLVTGPINIHHVNLQPVDAIATVLNAPVTAITHITELKPDAKPETVFEHLASLNTAAKSAGLAGFHAGTYGKVVENDELRTITGWDAINVGHPAVVLSLHDLDMSLLRYRTTELPESGMQR